MANVCGMAISIGRTYCTVSVLWKGVPRLRLHYHHLTFVIKKSISLNKTTIGWLMTVALIWFARLDFIIWPFSRFSLWLFKLPISGLGQLWLLPWWPCNRQVNLTYAVFPTDQVALCGATGKNTLDQCVYACNPIDMHVQFVVLCFFSVWCSPQNCLCMGNTGMLKLLLVRFCVCTSSYMTRGVILATRMATRRLPVLQRPQTDCDTALSQQNRAEHRSCVIALITFVIRVAWLPCTALDY